MIGMQVVDISDLDNGNKYRFGAKKKGFDGSWSPIAGRWVVVGCLSRTSGPFTLDGDRTVNQWHCTDIRNHMRKRARNQDKRPRKSRFLYSTIPYPE